MSEIDWSKAPEGATHYREGLARWYKQSCQAFEWSIDRWVLFANDLGEFRWSEQLIARPSPAWSGEGKPPVGEVCEAFYKGHPQGVVEVRYAGQCMILWSEDRKSEQCGQADDYWFKPIRTPEQIAADEREAAIKSLAELIGQEARCAGSPLKPGACLCIARTLVIDGYRKP